MKPIAIGYSLDVHLCPYWSSRMKLKETVPASKVKLPWVWESPVQTTSNNALVYVFLVKENLVNGTDTKYYM